MATGQLLSTLTPRIVVGIVSGETTVSEYLLLEDSDFLKVMQGADTLEQVIEWANENY